MNGRIENLRKCNCGGAFRTAIGKTEEGIEYKALACPKCGEELLTVKQAKKNSPRPLKTSTTLPSRNGGKAIAIRVPADIVRLQHLKAGQKAHVIPEPDGTGFRVKAAKSFQRDPSPHDGNFRAARNP
ncbi:hypothetical protein HY095_04220 [Candidatus Micrarchaeota archaeon]|nr:hypothetical protein [Candidatus Micrarchaeota archaeon]